MADQVLLQLFNRLGAEELRQYQGNLAAAIHVADNDWLPDPDNPEMREHLQTLRDYLADQGQPDDDLFLLRVGLTAPGSFRAITPPLEVLTPNRGGLSKRRLGEAEGQVQRLREALTLGRKVFPLLPEDTEAAIRALADLTAGGSAPVSWLDRLPELSADEADAMARQAIDWLAHDDKSVQRVGEEMLQQLACIREQALGESLCQLLIEQNIFYPGCLFRDSGDAIAAKLLERLEQGGDDAAHLLVALAWTRGRAATDAFERWMESEPPWTLSLNLAPIHYAVYAGWTLENGSRRDLLSTDCHHLPPLEDGAEADGSPVPCLQPIESPCPSCDGPLTTLFDFRQVPAAAFGVGERAEAPRRVVACPHCACYETVFTRYNLEDDQWQWLAPLERSEFDYASPARASVRRFTGNPLPPFAYAEPFALDDASTIGGAPMWVQDAAYPDCLECGRLMTFLAQLDNGAVGDVGCYYTFFCESCRVAAVNYQQT